MTQASTIPDAAEDSKFERIERILATVLAKVEMQNQQSHKQEQLLSKILEGLGNMDDGHLSAIRTNAGEGGLVMKPEGESRVIDLDCPGGDGFGISMKKVATNSSKVATNSFHGCWIDKTGGFFGGCPIEIDANGWRPRNSRHDGAMFTIKYISEAQCELIETRPDNTVRIFVVSLSTDGADGMPEADERKCLDVTFSSHDAQLTWRLSELRESRSRRSHVALLSAGAHTTSSMRKLFQSKSFRGLMSEISESNTFATAIGIIILANAVCIGSEIHYEVGPHGVTSPTSIPASLQIMEHVFLSIYVTELLINLVGKGVRACFTDKWFLFDFILVLMSSIPTWVLPFIQRRGSAEALNLDQVMVLRLVRLVRLIRAVRGIPQLRTAWRMTRGMMNSAATVISTLGLLAVMLFVFACVSIEVITKDQRLWAAHPEILEGSFSTLASTITTLFQFVTLDSVAGIYTPLIMTKPILVFFFLLVAMSISVVLMNLVTAVIVERALENAEADREDTQREAAKDINALRPLIENFFDTLDYGGKEYIIMEDLHDVHIADLPKTVQHHIKVGNMEDLYRLLDIQCIGRVDRTDFVEGILGMTLEYSGKASIETVLISRVLKVVNNMETTLNTITRHRRASSGTPVCLAGNSAQPKIKQKVIEFAI